MNERKSRFTFFAIITLFIACLVGYYVKNDPQLASLLGPVSARAQIGGARFGESQILNAAYDTVYDNFVDRIEDPEIQKKLEYGAIRGMLKALDDPYTRFVDPKAYENMTIETEGSFGGIGITIGIRNEQLTVITPFEDSPASKVGLKSGDIILKVNGEPTEEMALDDAVSRIRGKKGTKVKLTIWRRGFKSSDGKEFEITRDDIKVKPVNKTEMLEDDIAYIKLESFSKTSEEMIKASYLSLKGKGAKALILDLRFNPGGLLESAIECANLFIDEGPIVHRKNRTGTVKTYYAQKGRKIIDLPVVVLVNQYSASASEILSGALQDNKAATIMGETTFGKGLVQTVFPMRDNSAVLVTTDKYMTSKMRDINKKGITPDIIVTGDNVDAHAAPESETDDDSAKAGVIGKFPLDEIRGKNGVIFNGSPRKDIRYKEIDGKRYLEVDDVAKLFNMAMSLDEQNKILDIEDNPDKIKENTKDVQLDRAIEFLKNKIGEPYKGSAKSTSAPAPKEIKETDAGKKPAPKKNDKKK